MGLLSKLTSFLKKESSTTNIFEEAKKYDFFAPTFLLAIIGGSNGKMDAVRWISKEPQFAACYMVGFSFVLSESRTKEQLEIHPINIALYIFKRLISIDKNELDDASIQMISNAFYEYLMISSVKDDKSAFEMGYDDAVRCLKDQNSFPLGLSAHFEKFANN